MTKKFHINGKFPMKTLPMCLILKQLWKIVEKGVINVMQLSINYTDQDVIELQNIMEDEFTSIGKSDV